jgi:hypothetical protein
MPAFGAVHVRETGRRYGTATTDAVGIDVFGHGTVATCGLDSVS